MLRPAILFLLIAFAAVVAEAAELPRIDVKQHCAEVTGNRQNWVRCMGAENKAHTWLNEHQIDARIIRECSNAQRAAGGYVALRNCVQTKLGR